MFVFGQKLWPSQELLFDLRFVEPQRTPVLRSGYCGGWTESAKFFINCNPAFLSLCSLRTLRLKPVLQAGENQVGFEVVEAAGGRIFVVVVTVFQTRLQVFGNPAGQGGGDTVFVRRGTG